MFPLLWVLFLSQVFARDEFCPPGWKEGTFLCWRYTNKGVKFRDGIVDCITADRVKRGPVVHLIRVGQLRKLRGVHLERRFRVDAIKDLNGNWVEFLTGQPINFEYFPEFDPNAGSRGDTLVFDPKSDSLRVVSDTRDKYQGLCYRQKWGVSELCHQPGAENECSDHGDCINGVCACDDGFSGPKCEVSGRIAERFMTRPNKTLVENCQKFVSEDGSTACYVSIAGEVSYDEAAEACAVRGFELAEIHGEEDQKNLKAMAQPFKTAWIGLNKLNDDGNYIWQSGKKVIYTNWVIDPSLNPVSNRCVVLDPVYDFKWNDVSCETRSNTVAICRQF